jgi:hypothetical protein
LWACCRCCVIFLYEPLEGRLMVIQTERNLQLYESPGSPKKKKRNTNTHTWAIYLLARCRLVSNSW